MRIDRILEVREQIRKEIEAQKDYASYVHRIFFNENGEELFFRNYNDLFTNVCMIFKRPSEALDWLCAIRDKGWIEKDEEYGFYYLNEKYKEDKV